jgi:F-type H+-transporting ATPase subunit a
MSAVAGGAADAAEKVVEHAGGGSFDIAEMLTHHMVDGPDIELPFVGTVHLPVLHLGGWEIPITKHLVMMWVASAVLVTVLALVARRVRLHGGRAQGLIEMAVLFVRDEIAVKSMGEEDGRRWTPYLLTTFFFILFCNALGMVPYGASATANISVTGALAGLSLLMIHGSGMVRHGIVGHWKNYLPHGLPGWMFPVAVLLFGVEVVGTLFKSFALCMRLFANMIAGHMVMLSFLGLMFLITVWMFPVSVGLALFILVLELLVVPLQAYVFTLLTALFIGMSLHPQH